MTKPLRFCRHCGRADFNCECLSSAQIFGRVLGVLAMVAVMFAWGALITGMLGGL